MHKYLNAIHAGSSRERLRVQIQSVYTFHVLFASFSVKKPFTERQCLCFSFLYKKNQCGQSETWWLKYINNVTKLQNRRNNKQASLFQALGSWERKKGRAREKMREDSFFSRSSRTTESLEQATNRLVLSLFRFEINTLLSLSTFRNANSDFTGN